jgi:hypothetical protein
VHPIVEEKRAAIVELCRLHRVRRLDLFGSAAGENFDPLRSDLDFLVEIEDLAPASYSKEYFGLLEDLEDLFGRRIDLVVESAVTNPYFRESFQRSRVRLHAA